MDAGKQIGPKAVDHQRPLNQKKENAHYDEALQVSVEMKEHVCRNGRNTSAPMLYIQAAQYPNLEPGFLADIYIVRSATLPGDNDRS